MEFSKAMLNAWHQRPTTLLHLIIAGITCTTIGLLFARSPHQARVGLSGTGKNQSSCYLKTRTTCIPTISFGHQPPRPPVHLSSQPPTPSHASVPPSTCPFAQPNTHAGGC
jgi:hypothetical protein